MECSGEYLYKFLKALKSQSENEASQRLWVESLLSTVHFQVTKGHMLEPSPLDVQSRFGSSYMGVCGSSTRAREHGHGERSFWYGAEDKSINFLAVMRPSNVLSTKAISSEMIRLTGVIRTGQRRLKKEGRIAYALATDGDLFRFFRMREEGQTAETQCWTGKYHEDTIAILMSIFDDALAPPGACMTSPTAREVITEEENRRDQKRIHAMAVRVGVSVYMDVIQKLPNPLSNEAEERTLNLIRVVILRAIARPGKVTQAGYCDNGFPGYGPVVMRNFAAGLKKVLEEVDFVDYNYNHNQKVLKDALRKAILKEARPMFEEILIEVRKKKLEKFFKYG
ncbi:uncharacterized protein N7525_005739 [Penicillium rubens]|uniref:uncharacterized protein n=1 Tax=Penicillium rubens TaxID=1108849 RepID=UPI002A598B24|nr:uncharacterized protein N7525_005739 [Penicillium rubens]KAJ5840551.1 hypothetical protein N7525_005739 [Penicillium rubens]KAJ5868529.1 hypothetical protein N7534_003082 [Penicillium rubens]